MRKNVFDKHCVFCTREYFKLFIQLNALDYNFRLALKDTGIKVIGFTDAEMANRMWNWAIQNYADAFKIIKEIKKCDDDFIEQHLVWKAYLIYVRFFEDRDRFNRWLKDNNLWEGKKYRYAGIHRGFYKGRDNQDISWKMPDEPNS